MMKHGRTRKILIRTTRNQNYGAFIKIATIIAIAKIIWSVVWKIEIVAMSVCGPTSKFVCHLLFYACLECLHVLHKNPLVLRGIGYFRLCYSLYIGDVDLGVSAWTSPPWNVSGICYFTLAYMFCIKCICFQEVYFRLS